MTWKYGEAAGTALKRVSLLSEPIGMEMLHNRPIAVSPKVKPPIRTFHFTKSKHNQNITSQLILKLGSCGLKFKTNHHKLILHKHIKKIPIVTWLKFWGNKFLHFYVSSLKFLFLILKIN